LGPANERNGDDGPDDRILVGRLLDGDEDAMRLLVDRYDRLIRYIVFKTGRRHCDRDPGWLDARANEAWTGIVKSLRRGGPDNIPPSIPSYFAQIARNKCLDAVRVADARPVIPIDGPPEGGGEVEATVPDEDPVTLLESLEQLDVLRDCISRLSEEDRLLCSEIGLITERRWQEAAQRLEMAESTLRSRWRVVLGKLRACLEKKTQKNLAPEGRSTDS
jgi:RNA polymerase sigma factor (sigma-70 family)